MPIGFFLTSRFPSWIFRMLPARAGGNHRGLLGASTDRFYTTLWRDFLTPVLRRPATNTLAAYVATAW